MCLTESSNWNYEHALEGQNLSDEKRLATLRRKVQRRNHPPKGSSIKVDPIRELSAIMTIKTQLQNQPRNLCLFILGINTAYRAGELLSLDIGDVADLKVGDIIDLKQSKTDEYRMATLNGVSYSAIQKWLAAHPRPRPSSPLFPSQRGGSIGVPRVHQLVKGWCKEIELKGNYGSHTLRKTWGYHQRIQHNTPVALLMRAYGHASEAQTLDYLGIQPEEIRDLYLKQELGK